MWSPAPHAPRTRFAAAAALLVAAGCAPEPPSPPPNVLLVTLDTTRADHLGLYGYGRPTSPNLDDLAQESVVFENAYSTSSWTLPAHASLFTGKAPASHGARHDPAGPLVLADAIDAPAGLRARGIGDGETTLAWILRAAGYTTGAVVGGPWLLRPFGLGKGFDAYDDEGVTSAAGRRAQEITDHALRWLEGEAREPFFLFLNYFDPHVPYAPPPGWAGSFLPPGETPRPRSLRQAPALYDAEILYMDHHFGRLLRRLREQGLYARTLVVVTSDHGELLGDRGLWGHERYLWEPLVRVPLLVKPPGPRQAGRRETERVSLVDVVPMILEQARLEVPAGVQGEVLPGARRPVLAEVNPASARSDTGVWRALWQGRFKVIANSFGETYLFDLDADPGEEHNLAEIESERGSRAAGELARAFGALPPPPPPGAPVRVDPATLEALHQLGYLGSAEPEDTEARSQTRMDSSE